MMDEDAVDDKKLALGLKEHLKSFAIEHRARTWDQIAASDPENWDIHFLKAMNDPEMEVYFNLTGVDVWGGITREAAGHGGWTDWELLEIRQHSEWWPRIRWMKRGEAVRNPFEPAE